MESVSVLVVSADPLARSGLAALVGRQPGLVLAGEVGPLEAARMEASTAPQAVLWDMGSTARIGAALAQLAELAAPIVALASDVAQAGEALRAGSRSVLARDVTPAALGAAIACTAGGLTVLDRELAASFLRAPEVPSGTDPLTAREREVLALLAEGLANKAIAARLGISEHTAKFHVNAILAKLGVDSRAEAIVRAVRLGLVVL